MRYLRTCYACMHFPNCSILKSYNTETDEYRVELLNAYGKNCTNFMLRDG